MHSSNTNNTNNTLGDVQMHNTYEEKKQLMNELCNIDDVAQATTDNRQQLYEVANWMADGDMQAALRARWRPLEWAEPVDGWPTVRDWRDGTHWQWRGDAQTIEQLNALLEVHPGACVSIGWLVHFDSDTRWHRLG